MKDQDKLRENVSDLACKVASVCHSVDVLKTVKKHMQSTLTLLSHISQADTAESFVFLLYFSCLWEW